MVRHPSMLTCKEVVELVTELLSDAMPAADRVHLEQHLLVCPPCMLHVQQVKATIELTSELRAPAPAAAPAILALFRRWRAP
jgi:hypothetical protein